MFLVLQEWFEDLNEKSVNIIVNSSIMDFILIVVAFSYLIGIAYNPGNVYGCLKRHQENLSHFRSSARYVLLF